jgi:putative CocE/NonD family hydrolase
MWPNVDPRGIGHSQGDANLFGTQDARDGYDFIEWLATQHWCNGKIGMFGNSGVAMVQWRIAAEQPPHKHAAGFNGPVPLSPPSKKGGSKDRGSISLT